MSDGTPFARTSSEEGDGWPVVVGAVVFYCGSRSAAQDYAKSINAAIEAERREAAAKALEEAADNADSYAEDAMEALGHHDGTLSDATRQRIATWLRSRADAVERGEA